MNEIKPLADVTKPETLERIARALEILVVKHTKTMLNMQDESERQTSLLLRIADALETIVDIESGIRESTREQTAATERISDCVIGTGVMQERFRIEIEEDDY